MYIFKNIVCERDRALKNAVSEKERGNIRVPSLNTREGRLGTPSLRGRGAYKNTISERERARERCLNIPYLGGRVMFKNTFSERNRGNLRIPFLRGRVA